MYGFEVVTNIMRIFGDPKRKRKTPALERHPNQRLQGLGTARGRTFFRGDIFKV